MARNNCKIQNNNIQETEPIKDCFGNVNCVNCMKCYNCVNCFNCVDCVGCQNVSNLYRCINSTKEIDGYNNYIINDTRGTYDGYIVYLSDKYGRKQEKLQNPNQEQIDSLETQRKVLQQDIDNQEKQIHDLTIKVQTLKAQQLGIDKDIKVINEQFYQQIPKLSINNISDIMNIQVLKNTINLEDKEYKLLKLDKIKNYFSKAYQIFYEDRVEINTPSKDDNDVLSYKYQESKIYSPIITNKVGYNKFMEQYGKVCNGGEKTVFLRQMIQQYLTSYNLGINKADIYIHDQQTFNICINQTCKILYPDDEEATISESVKQNLAQIDPTPVAKYLIEIAEDVQKPIELNVKSQLIFGQYVFESIIPIKIGDMAFFIVCQTNNAFNDEKKNFQKFINLSIPNIDINEVHILNLQWNVEYGIKINRIEKRYLETLQENLHSFQHLIHFNAETITVPQELKEKQFKYIQDLTNTKLNKIYSQLNEQNKKFQLKFKKAKINE